VARRRRDSIGQTIGGVLFGFEQQVLRTQPPPQELVHHARPDAAIPAGDGTLVTIRLPDDPPGSGPDQRRGGPREPDGRHEGE
jgi:hypothetical protein